MKPVDMLGFGPTRTAVATDNGWLVTVTPPEIVQLKGHTIRLSNDQYERYLSWHNGGGLIQDALPDLTGAQREILMTGIGDEDFHEIGYDQDYGEDDHQDYGEDDHD